MLRPPVQPQGGHFSNVRRNPPRRIAMPLVSCLLLGFGSLTRAPSNECGRCLLSKLGLAQFTARRFWGLDDWCRAFNIFDALPPHTFAASYARPIRNTPHNALTLNMHYTAKPPGNVSENRRLCLSAPNDAASPGSHRRGCRIDKCGSGPPSVRPRNHTPAFPP